MAGFLLHPPRRPPVVAVGAAIAGKLNTGPRPDVGPPAIIAPSSRPQTSGITLIEPNTSARSNVKLVKGRFTNTVTRYFREFMFNPTTIQRSDGWDWGRHGIPMLSHRVYGGGAGAERPINFTLYLDADRGRKELRFAGERDSGGSDLVIRDVQSDIDFFRSFTFPVSSDGISFRGPATAILTYGSMFPSVEVIVDSVNVTLIEMSPDLRPMKAQVDLSLMEIARFNVTSQQVFSTPDDISSDTEIDTPIGGELE